MDLFEFDDVLVRFGDTVVLDHVSCSIPDGGSVTCLLGASGAGKSTLLRLCNRLEVPTSGQVRFRGRPLDDIDPLELRRDVGMVFQRPTLFPGTVRANLLVADPDADEPAMVEVLHRAALPASFLDRDGDSLSGGEAQRACLARTLITRPDVLLMDEPTSALDPTATKELEELGRALADAGMPVLWVTHDLHQADRIADRRIVLVRGRLADEHQATHYLAGEAGDHDHEEADGEQDAGGEEVTDGRG
ncbi:MAG TPA: phosphate ABC transporter ATP-binding protein [Acidimicrobiales bacterium]|nr:phosphate ABC transporter ATP-binding protein [Acidimicrobiales bacterium]